MLTPLAIPCIICCLYHLSAATTATITATTTITTTTATTTIIITTTTATIIVELIVSALWSATSSRASAASASTASAPDALVLSTASLELLDQLGAASGEVSRQTVQHRQASQLRLYKAHIAEGSGERESATACPPLQSRYWRLPLPSSRTMGSTATAASTEGEREKTQEIKVLHLARHTLDVLTPQQDTVSGAAD